MIRLRSIVVIAVLSAVSCLAGPSSDGEKMAQGRIALEKYRDCNAARQLFASVSAARRDRPDWLDYAAQSAECAGDLAEALRYYEAEATYIVGSERLADKVADLRYRIGKEEKERRQEQIRAEQLRLQQLRHREVLRQNIAVDYRKLEQAWQFAGGPETTHYNRYAYRRTDQIGCKLRFERTQEYDSGGTRRYIAAADFYSRDYDIEFDGNDKRGLAFIDAKTTWTADFVSISGRKSGTDPDFKIFALDRGVARDIATALQGIARFCRALGDK